MKYKHLILFLAGSWVLPVTAQEMDGYQRCLVETLAHADSTVTAGDIRKSCEDRQAGQAGDAEAGTEQNDRDTAVARRMHEELSTQDKAFVLTPYKPNYILLAAYNTAGVNERPFEEAFPGKNPDLNDTEVKFQISFKFPVVKSLFGDNGDLYAAYTNRSFWQVYNTDSSPFRETNHEPEAWLRFYNDLEFLGIRNVLNDIGVVHQSNGRSGSLSRSWNRIYARFVFESGNAGFAIQPWYRIKESKNNDDNPDIEDYLGNFEFQGAYKWGEHEFGLMFRNNLDFDVNRGAAQLDWSFPIHGRLRGYVQWFNGYGESLIDYNQNVNSFGVGIKLTDWL
ncbi:phospholipase A [Thiolapillus sp.]